MPMTMTLEAEVGRVDHAECNPRGTRTFSSISSTTEGRSLRRFQWPAMAEDTGRIERSNRMRFVRS